MNRPIARQAVARLIPNSGIPTSEEIYLVGADGGEVRQVSRLKFLPEDGPDLPGTITTHWDCPVWSPDGRFLAAFVDTGHSTYLALLPVETGAGVTGRPRYLRLEYRSAVRSGLQTATR